MTKKPPSGQTPGGGFRLGSAGEKDQAAAFRPRAAGFAILPRHPARDGSTFGLPPAPPATTCRCRCADCRVASCRGDDRNAHRSRRPIEQQPVPVAMSQSSPRVTPRRTPAQRSGGIARGAVRGRHGRPLAQAAEPETGVRPAVAGPGDDRGGIPRMLETRQYIDALRGGL